jgi:photosystem II stability/assembly factor-like uncharacterized protein
MRYLSYALVAVLVLFVSFPADAQIQGTNWFPIGPSPEDGFFAGGVSGRATAIAFNPSRIDEVWLGTATGGVWHTLDGGLNWEPESDREDSLAIGAMAVDGCNAAGCAVIYAGTGENAIRRDTYYGAGLLVGSTTGGEFPQFVWTQRTGAPVADFRFGSINDVVLDPTTSGGSKRVFVTFSSGVTVAAPESTVTAPEPSGGFGIYRSNDNGATWAKLTVAGSNSARPTDLKMHPGSGPGDHDILFAGFLGRGVFRSTDGGNNWCPLNAGIPKPAGCPNQQLPDISTLTFDHVEIAIAPSDPSTVYATFGRCGDRLLQNCVPALWKSTNGGNSWNQQMPGNPGNDAADPSIYSRYTHPLTVDRTNASRIFLGGVHLWRSDTSGTVGSWVESDTNVGPGSGLTDVHLDHHEVLFASNTRVYNTSDGGFAMSNDAGVTWTPRNDDLQTTGFQGLDSSAAIDKVIGTAQDNGGMLWNGGSRRWAFKINSDGGFSIYDDDDAMTMYVGTNFGALSRSTDGGNSWTGISGPWGTDPRLFYAPFIEGPTAVAGNHPLFFGTNRLWRSTSTHLQPVTWAAISPVLATGNFPEIVTTTSTAAQAANPDGGQNAITAIGVAPSDSNRIYVGYYGGQIFRSNGAPCEMAACWVATDSSTPDVPVTAIAVDPAAPNTAYATFSGFGNHARVWKTTNGGTNWTPIATGLPAGIPANAIAIEPVMPRRIYLGLDSGPDGASLFRSTNDGASWQPFAQGLPNAPIYQISLDNVRGRAYAGTHGRGAFVLSRPFISNFEGWVHDSIWDIPVYGNNFIGAHSPCTMSVLQSNGSVCATGTVDVKGGTIQTDAAGVLQTSLGGMWSGQKVAWACFNGTCVGGVPIGQCYDDADGDGDPDPLSSIHVNCDGQIATGTVLGCPPLDNPPSSFLTLDSAMGAGGGGGGGGPAAMAIAEMPAGRERQFDGVLRLVASVQRRVGTASLCTVNVPYRRGESDATVLERAQAAVNASPTCAANRVRAQYDSGRPEGQHSEDQFGRPPRLFLRAPGIVGGQLITALHVDPGASGTSCVKLNGLGVPALSQIHVLKIDLITPAGGAAGGGTITMTEQTPLGPCRITIPTVAGQNKNALAAAMVGAIMAPGIPGPHPDCPSERNARDITNHGGSLISVFVDVIELCTTDPKIGFDLRPEELLNVHPVAEAGDDRVLPSGSPASLSGMLSADPDSTPGTRDDIASFEWFEVTSGPAVPLGTGETLNVPLADGLHRVRLRVTDKAGLADTDETLLSIGGSGGGGGSAGGRWRGSFHVGSAHPVGKSSGDADANIHVRTDFGYLLTDRVRLLLMAGLSQLTAESGAGIPHPRWLNLSLDAQGFFPIPSSNTTFFVEAGPGIYWPKSGSSKVGFNAGLGFQLPIGGPYRLELGADYNRVPSAHADFVTVQLGVLFR